MEQPRLLSPEENKKYLDLFLSLVQQDHGLSQEEKQIIATQLNHPNTIQTLLSGSLGAGLALAVSKYLKLHPTSQVLLSLAGFGIGKYLLEKLSNRDIFMKYDKGSKLYHLNF